MKYTAVLLAGSRPGPDPFAEQFGTDLKALIAIAGEPMVRRPVRSLLASDRVGQIVVLSQAPSRIADVIVSNPSISIRKSAGTIAETMLALCGDPETRWPLLVTTADHALLDTSTVDEFCSAATGADLAVAVVERDLMMKRFPRSERTWLKFRGGAYTGANLFALATPKVIPIIQMWRSVEQDRKKGWRLIATLGPLVLTGALLRLLSIDHVLQLLARKFDASAKVVRLSNPMAGIDVDKPADHTLVEDILAGRA